MTNDAATPFPSYIVKRTPLELFQVAISTAASVLTLPNGSNYTAPKQSCFPKWSNTHLHYLGVFIPKTSSDF